MEKASDVRIIQIYILYVNWNKWGIYKRKKISQINCIGRKAPTNLP